MVDTSSITNERMSYNEFLYFYAGLIAVNDSNRPTATFDMTLYSVTFVPILQDQEFLAEIWTMEGRTIKSRFKTIRIY